MSDVAFKLNSFLVENDPRFDGKVSLSSADGRTVDLPDGAGLLDCTDRHLVTCLAMAKLGGIKVGLVGYAALLLDRLAGGVRASDDEHFMEQLHGMVNGTFASCNGEVGLAWWVSRFAFVKEAMGEGALPLDGDRLWLSDLVVDYVDNQEAATKFQEKYADVLRVS